MFALRTYLFQQMRSFYGNFQLLHIFGLYFGHQQLYSGRITVTFEDYEALSTQGRSDKPVRGPTGQREHHRSSLLVLPQHEAIKTLMNRRRQRRQV